MRETITVWWFSSRPSWGCGVHDDDDESDIKLNFIINQSLGLSRPAFLRESVLLVEVEEIGIDFIFYLRWYEVLKFLAKHREFSDSCRGYVDSWAACHEENSFSARETTINDTHREFTIEVSKRSNASHLHSYMVYISDLQRNQYRSIQHNPLANLQCQLSCSCLSP